MFFGRADFPGIRPHDSVRPMILSFFFSPVLLWYIKANQSESIQIKAEPVATGATECISTLPTILKGWKSLSRPRVVGTLCCSISRLRGWPVRLGPSYLGISGLMLRTPEKGLHQAAVPPLVVVSSLPPERTPKRTGPRAVLGSQRAPTRQDARILSTLPQRSDALRAEDGSRSVVVSRCARRHPAFVKMLARPRSPN